MSLTDKDSSIWSDPNQVAMGLYRNNTDAVREVYTWDLRGLGNRGIFSNLKNNDPFWYKMWLKSYSDDEGDALYKSLPTIFTVSPFNYLDATAHVYSGSFEFSPLIPNSDINGNQNAETYDAEYAIWQSMLFPAMPMILSTTLLSRNMFGPVFFKRVAFAVSGEGGLSPVNIDVEFSGGKAIKAPMMDIAPPITIDYNGTTDYQAYRTASMIDCLSAQDVFTDLQSLKDYLEPFYELEKISPTNRIIEMKLSMTQDVDFIFTGNKGSNSDSDGPRFVEIKNRKVSGSISYFSKNHAILVGTSSTNPDTGSLTMYFGGPFLFPMSNIEWQKPIVKQIPGQGWYHLYNFIARAADNAIQMGFKTSDLPVSEFDLGTVILDSSEDNA